MSSSDWLNSTGFPGVCVSRSLTSRLETKMPWSQTPSRKKKAAVFTAVTTNAYQGQINAGFSKICEIFNLRHRIFKICLRVLHTDLLLWRHFHAQKHDGERNKL